MDPNGVVPMLLSSRGTEQKQDASFWQVKLRHWTLPDAFAPFAAQPEIANPHEANFKNKFKLLGWNQPQPLPADQGASVRLYWQALDAIPDDYNVALRIVDDKGNFWGKVDRRPAGYNYPTTRWNKGDTVFGDYVATLLPGTPAGDYFVTATMFTQQDQTGLNVLAPNGAPLGKIVKIGPIKILPAEKQPSLTDLNIQHSLSAPVAPFTLLGYQIGSEKASTGESIPVTLFWRADQKPDARLYFPDSIWRQVLRTAAFGECHVPDFAVGRGRYGARAVLGSNSARCEREQWQPAAAAERGRQGPGD